MTLFDARLTDPLWLFGTGIVVLVPLMVLLAVRSPEFRLTMQQKQRSTHIVLGIGIICILIWSGEGLLAYKQASVGTDAAQNTFSSSSARPTPTSIPTLIPTPTPSPLPLLARSTVQVLTTYCNAITSGDEITVWDQYSKQVQQQLLANKRHWAARDQIRIVHCNRDKVNEQLADGFLLFKTVDGNGKNIGDNEEELYDITLDVEKNAWKITAILHCITDGCLNVTGFIIL